MIRSDSLFDEISDGICISEEGGAIVYLNPAARRMLEVPDRLQEPLNSCRLLCGKLFAEGSDDPCSAHCALRDLQSPARAVAFQGRHGPQSSSAMVWNGDRIKRLERWGQYRVRCLRISGPLWSLPAEARHFTLIEDVSAENELARRKEEWRRMMVHDLRSPLTSILAALRSLETAPADRALGAPEREMLRISVGACGKMARLLDAVLELSQLDEGTMPLSPRRVPLRALVEKVAAELAYGARPRGVTVEIEGDAEVEALADEGLLQRVAQNLLDNALKFSPRGGRVRAVIGRERGWASLAVKDEGPGVPPEDVPSLFDRFARLSSAKVPGAGNGLGLAFCREALKAMGGEIAVRSEPGRGSEFIARLPTGEEDASP